MGEWIWAIERSKKQKQQYLGLKKWFYGVHRKQFCLKVCEQNRQFWRRLRCGEKKILFLFLETFQSVAEAFYKNGQAGHWRILVSPGAVACFIEVVGIIRAWAHVKRSALSTFVIIGENTTTFNTRWIGNLSKRGSNFIKRNKDNYLPISRDGAYQLSQYK